MKVIETGLAGVLIFENEIFRDPRGYLMEAWNQARYARAGLTASFVQDNLSFSSKGVLRGLHFQNPNMQGKMVFVLQGEIYDVAVDIRAGSPTFGRWVAVVLSEENRRQLFIPEGFAHGFCVTSETAMVFYKCTDLYTPAASGGIIWNDPDLGIPWPVGTPILSEKDKAYPSLKEMPPGCLPKYGG